MKLSLIKDLSAKFNEQIDPAYRRENQKVLERFAEMIVLECARIVEDSDDTWTGQGSASAQAIKDYFFEEN